MSNLRYHLTLTFDERFQTNPIAVPKIYSGHNGPPRRPILVQAFLATRAYRCPIPILLTRTNILSDKLRVKVAVYRITFLVKHAVREVVLLFSKFIRLLGRPNRAQSPQLDFLRITIIVAWYTQWLSLHQSSMIALRPLAPWTCQLTLVLIIIGLDTKVSVAVLSMINFFDIIRLDRVFFDLNVFITLSKSQLIY